MISSRFVESLGVPIPLSAVAKLSNDIEKASRQRMHLPPRSSALKLTVNLATFRCPQLDVRTLGGSSGGVALERSRDQKPVVGNLKVDAVA
jgi:hypothetical protein